jgi:hypothetical protein
MLQTFLKHKFVSGLSLFSLLFSMSGFIWAYRALGNAGGGSFVLHFNDISGITSIGGLGTIVFMGISGVLIVLVNGAIALEFESRDRFFGKLIAVLTLFFSVLLFIGFAAIISVN